MLTNVYKIHKINICFDLSKRCINLIINNVEVIFFSYDDDFLLYIIWSLLNQHYNKKIHLTPQIDYFLVS